jgi:hypothetical protein
MVAPEHDVGSIVGTAFDIRGAEPSHQDASPPESSGTRAVFDDLRDADLSDDERLRIGSAFCDALYAFCSAS